jgi:hypothetical protein
MKQLNYFLIAVLCVLVVSACKKNGRGGKSKVNGTVEHHGNPVPNATVYIKYNTKEFAGEDVTKYDSYVTANPNGFYEIDNFYKGDYYLYAVGLDHSIAAPYVVVGGISVSVKSAEEKSIDIPVGEE